MTYFRQLVVSALFLCLAVATISGQTRSQGQPDAIARMTLTIDDRSVRFTTSGEVRDWRLEITDQQGQSVFDSGFLVARELDWQLAHTDGQPVAGGLYDYTVSIKTADGVRTHRGQLTVQRTTPAYQVMVTGDEPSTGTSVNVVNALESGNGSTPDPGTAVSAPSVSAPSLRQPLSGVSFASVQPAISGSGTTGRITKWVDGPTGVVGDTQLSEANGWMVVGNVSFPGNIQIYGPSNNDLFAGMGPDVANGPAFNFGYGAATFGRSAGFFNVRPDALATPPNPSLRFMTANLQRMIITNAGNVGIGPVMNPGARLAVVDSNGRNGTVQIGSDTSWITNDRRILNFGDTDMTYLGEEDADNLLTFRAVDFRFKEGRVLPGSDGVQNLGALAARWNTIFATNGAINTSDARLKKAIANLSDGLSRVMKLRPVSFEWKHGDSRRHLGLLAQEVERAVPEVVYRDAAEDSPLGISYAELIPVVIKAVQEQQALLAQKDEQLTALQTAQAILQQQNRELNSRVLALERMLERLTQSSSGLQPPATTIRK